MDDFNRFKHEIKDEVIRKRAEHVIAEDDRVLKSVEALKNDDIAFSAVRSHHMIPQGPLRGNRRRTRRPGGRGAEGGRRCRFEDDWRGLWRLHCQHCQGRRRRQFIDEVGRGYTARTGLVPSFYISEVGDGGRELK